MSGYEVRPIIVNGVLSRWKVTRFRVGTPLQDYGEWHNRDVAQMVAEFLRHADNLDAGSDEARAAEEENQEREAL